MPRTKGGAATTAKPKSKTKPAIPPMPNPSRPLFQFNVVEASMHLQGLVKLYCEIHESAKSEVARALPDFLPWRIGQFIPALDALMPAIREAISPHLSDFRKLRRQLTIGDKSYESAHVAACDELWQFAMDLWGVSEGSKHGAYINAVHNAN